MKSILMLCVLCAFGLTNVSAEPIDNVGKKAGQKIVEKKQVKDYKRSSEGDVSVQALQPGSTFDGGLCSPNDIVTCKTNVVSQGEKVCHQDECTCSNANGQGTYSSTGVKYECVDKIPNVPVEVKPIGRE